MEKRHNVVKIVLVTILVFLLLSWILPAAYFQTSYVEQGRVQMGLFDLFNYPATAISYFGYVAVFILVVGGFYGVLNKIGAYRKMLDSLATTLKKKGILTISIMMVLLAAMASICGLQLGLIMFFPLIISLILLMGYDKIVAALTVVGSTMIGIAGTTFAYSNTNVLTTILGVKVTASMLIKVLVLVLGLALLIGNTVIYIIKHNKTTKKTTKKAAKKDTKNEVKEDTESLIPVDSKTKSSIVPMIVVFSIIFVIMILSFIPWVGGFNNKAFETATSGVTGFKVFKFALFGKLLGNVNAFGSWTITDLCAVMIIAIIVLTLIYKVKLNETLDAFFEGMKKALMPAIITVLIYTCLVITTYHPFQLVIYKSIFGLTKGFNIFTTAVTGIFASVFNAEPLYAFQAVVPYLASIVSKDSYEAIAALYPAIYGLTMLVAPTSVVLMVVLSYMGISYKDWFKSIWKVLLQFLIVILILFLIFSKVAIALKIVAAILAIAVVVLMTISSLSKSK